MSAKISNHDSQEQYAAAIYAHALRSQDRYLFSGVNFRQFAEFLNRPATPRTMACRGADPANPFVVVYDLSSIEGKTTTKPQHFDRVFVDDANHALPVVGDDCGQIVFMRGFASQQWIKFVGAQHKIDPEYFRRHLDFFQLRECPDTSHLPSSARNIVRLRVTDVFTRQAALSLRQVQQAREDSGLSIRAYQRIIRQNASVGDSILRKLSILDETTFALEYDIAICVKGSHKKGWTALIWVDLGTNLADCPPGPWINSQSHTLQAACKPITQHRQKLALERCTTNEEAIAPETLSALLFQSGSLLPKQYGSSMSPSLMRVDVMYALSEVFSFAASSEWQFLNVLETQLNDESQNLSAQIAHVSVANIRYAKALLDEHVVRLEDTTRMIRDYGDSKWPRAASLRLEEDAISIVRESHDYLTKDYEYLLMRARRLSERCVETIDIISNDALLQEAQKSLQQGQRGQRLMFLASFYLPLSLTTSFFGMNFVELGQGKLSIWLAFVTCLPVLLISTMIHYWYDVPWSQLFGMAQGMTGKRMSRSKQEKSREDDV